MKDPETKPWQRAKKLFMEKLGGIGVPKAVKTHQLGHSFEGEPIKVPDDLRAELSIIKKALIRNNELIEQRTEEYDRIFDGNHAEIFSAMEMMIQVLDKFDKRLIDLSAKVELMTKEGMEKAMTTILRDKDELVTKQLSEKSGSKLIYA